MDFKQETLDGSDYVFEIPPTKRRNPALFTSMSDHYRTPSTLYAKLNKEFDFTFDPCPLDRSPKFDGLRIDWGDRNFCNPPYSEWQKWVLKGFQESLKGKLVVFLIAARTSTKAWHDIILPYADEIRFLRGRLKFDDSNKPAPFESVIVVFKGDCVATGAGIK